MKNVILSSLMACGLLLATGARAEEAAPAPVDPAVQLAQQQEAVYGLVCTPTAELNADQLTALTNEQNLSLRQAFQSFVSSPKTYLGDIFTTFKKFETQAEAILNDPKNAELLAADIKDYMTQNPGVSEADAKAAVSKIVIEQIVAGQTGGVDLKTAVAQTSVQSCQLIEFVKAQLEKSGCKNADTSEAIDLSVATKLCTDLAPSIQSLAGYEQEVSKIQEQLKLYIAALQQAAQIQAQPFFEGQDKAAQDILDVVSGLVGDQTSVEVPLAVTP
jgi:hypothetical protein